MIAGNIHRPVCVSSHSKVLQIVIVYLKMVAKMRKGGSKVLLRRVLSGLVQSSRSIMTDRLVRIIGAMCTIVFFIHLVAVVITFTTIGYITIYGAG